MTPLNFCYWLQGQLELNPDTNLTPEQVTQIREHLGLVFKTTEKLLHYVPSEYGFSGHIIEAVDIPVSC